GISAVVVVQTDPEVAVRIRQVHLAGIGIERQKPKLHLQSRRKPLQFHVKRIAHETSGPRGSYRVLRKNCPRGIVNTYREGRYNGPPCFLTTPPSPRRSRPRPGTSPMYSESCRPSTRCASTRTGSSGSTGFT